MSNWPLSPTFPDIEQGGANTGDSGVVTVTGGVRSLGSWTEIIAATSFEWASFIMLLYTATVRGYYQIGIGGSGTEVIVAEFPLKVGGFRGRNGLDLPVPINIPNGSRVSIRSSGHSATTIQFGLVGFARAGIPLDPQFVTCDTIGLEKGGGSTTHGQKTVVDPGGTAHTKSGWVEIDASLAEDYRAIDILFDDNQNGAQTDHERLWDFAIGAGGSEIIIAPDIYQGVDGGESVGPKELRIPAMFPSGTRFAARMQCSIIDATDRLGGCALIGYR